MEKMKQEQIDRRISDIKAIWGIEGMDVSPEQEARTRDFLSGKITKEELLGAVLEKSTD